MANGGEGKSKDFYKVLGLDKECTPTELRNAYKKLALKWHPDRCSASGNSKFIEEAKEKFQAIQQAYAVLSDDNKRFLYDVGVYESDDDENGIGDFMNEMAVMMGQTNPSENGVESFQQLQELFEEMFQADIESLGSGCSTSASYSSVGESSNSNNLHCSMSSVDTKVDGPMSFDSHFLEFCFGTSGTPSKFQEVKGSKTRNARNGNRQKGR